MSKKKTNLYHLSFFYATYETLIPIIIATTPPQTKSYVRNIITLGNVHGTWYCNRIITNPITDSELHAPPWRVGLPAAIPPTKRSQSQSPFVRHRSVHSREHPPNLLRLAGDGIKSTRPSLHPILELHVNPFSGKIFDATGSVKFRSYSVLSIICENTFASIFHFSLIVGSNSHWVTSVPFLRVICFTRLGR